MTAPGDRNTGPGTRPGAGARQTILAIDAGNSKTDVALVAADGTVLATARGGGFRPQAVGVVAAVDVLAGIVAEVLPEAQVEHVSAYLAGADLPAEEEELLRELTRRGWGRGVEVGNDTFALLRTGAAEGWGVAVVCGAGINCVGVAPDGRVTRFPALGRITGDWGGGDHLGRAALWHAVRGEDGRGPATALIRAVADHFGVEHAVDVGLAIHLGTIPVSRLGELTPVLLDTGATGDAVACQIIERMAEEITVLGTVALRRLGLLRTPAEVVLGGGVLSARHPALIRAVTERYARRAPSARPVIVDAPPVLGAALLGLDHIGAPPTAHQRLRAAFGAPGRRVAHSRGGRPS